MLFHNKARRSDRSNAGLMRASLLVLLRVCSVKMQTSLASDIVDLYAPNLDSRG